MKLEVRIITTILFVVITTTLLFFIENRSNIPSVIIIPILVSILTKYMLGDWDRGYRFTLIDIFYWVSILTGSYATLIILESRKV
jgi:hypothetical protein